MKKKCLMIAVILISNVGFAQTTTDTAALIKEFGKVMAFTSKPSIYYTTTTKMSADPIMESIDTLSVTGEFYKNNMELYSSNSREEMYLQDSLMIEINNERKTILVRKVDVATKSNMNLLPVNTKEIIEKFKRDYTIRGSKVSGDISRINFEGRKPEYSSSTTTTFITVEYSEKTYLPRLIEVVIELKQPADQEILAAIKAEGMDESKLVKVINGVKHVFRKQTVRIEFTSINSNSEKTAIMPSYKSKLEFNAEAKEFVGKGQYKDYEITMTF